MNGGLPIRISPRAKVLPANTLRFFIHFPRPGEAHFDRDQLWLLDDEEQVVREPFLVLSQELWSPDGRRLTVLMEPGRIKRGLGAGASHDPALVVGRTYSLVVTALGQTARHTFRVSAPVLQAMNESSWRLVSPTAGSLDPAVVHFDRVMDSALCEDEIRVLSASGEVVPTRASLAPDGAAMQFFPRRPWSAGEHRLVVSERLEDVCGNRLGEALDHDLGAGGRPRAAMIDSLRAAPSAVDLLSAGGTTAAMQSLSRPLVGVLVGIAVLVSACGGQPGGATTAVADACAPEPSDDTVSSCVAWQENSASAPVVLHFTLTDPEPGMSIVTETVTTADGTSYELDFSAASSVGAGATQTFPITTSTGGTLFGAGNTALMLSISSCSTSTPPGSSCVPGAGECVPSEEPTCENGTQLLDLGQFAATAGNVTCDASSTRQACRFTNLPLAWGGTTGAASGWIHTPN